MSFEPIIAAFGIALLSLTGIVIARNHVSGRAFRTLFLPLSIGMFLGVTFFELLPEAFAMHEQAGLAVTAGFLGFFLLSRLLSEYHHHHGPGEHPHPSRSRASLILVADGVHNFADGVVIVAAFLVDPTLGWLAAIAVALHEIPQEIAEFSILVNAGYSRARALAYNFASALTIVVGAALSLWFIESFEGLVGVLLAIAAGNLLYIAASDLLPELIAERESRNGFYGQFLMVCAGCALIASLVFVAHEQIGGHDHDTHGTEEEHHDEDSH